jgi:PEP-CTERM motif-containing protein
MKNTIVGLACTALLGSGAASASADPITITGGFISATSAGVTVNLASNALGLNLVGSGETFQMPLAFGFHAGQTVDFSATLAGLVEVLGSSSTGRTASLQVSLFAVPVSTPFGTFAHLQTPFTMSGNLDGAAVFGAGTLTLGGERVSGLNVSGITSAAYAFSPTPEPASLLLLGTGVVGIAVRRFPSIGRPRTPRPLPHED